MLSAETLEKVLETYGRAWTEQDPDLILTIFTPEATYQEYAFQDAFLGHDEIRQYWVSKVVEDQSNIEFQLRNSYIDGDTAIAEWDASFDSVEESCRIQIREVAILEFEGERIASLREYWAWKKVEQVS